MTSSARLQEEANVARAGLSRALAGGARLLPRGCVGAVVLVGEGASGGLGGAALRGLDAGRFRGRSGRRRGGGGPPGHVGGGLAPLLGQHNMEVLTEMLGYTQEEVDRLERDGVLAMAKETSQ